MSFSGPTLTTNVAPSGVSQSKSTSPCGVADTSRSALGARTPPGIQAVRVLAMAAVRGATARAPSPSRFSCPEISSISSIFRRRAVRAASDGAPRPRRNPSVVPAVIGPLPPVRRVGDFARRLARHRRFGAGCLPAKYAPQRTPCRRHRRYVPQPRPDRNEPIRPATLEIRGATHYIAIHWRQRRAERRGVST